MEENYSNTEIILSDLDHKKEFFSETPSWTREKSTIVTHRMTRFLLAVLCLILLCGLTALGVLYVEKSNVLSSLKAQNSSASFFSLEPQMVEKHTNMSDFLEAQNRNLSASLASVQQKLAEEISIANSLEDQNRNLSASLSSLQQKLAEAERQLQELQTNHSDLLKTLLSYKESRGYRECGSGWRKYMGQCYFFSTQKLNWMQSCDFCMSKGAKLVIIDLEQEQTFVSSIISETHWIGLSDLGTEGQWHWVDDRPLSQTKHQFWYQRPNRKHEPDNWTGGGDSNGEDCAAIGDKSGAFDKWFDASCTEQKRFVCEK